MKTVLIMVLSYEIDPYKDLIQTSLDTWDLQTIPGTETIFYCGVSEYPDTDKIIHLSIDEGLFNIGHKTLLAFEWALKNKQFDYLARPNASCYVNKRQLLSYVQDLPETGVVCGLETTGDNIFIWGGGQYIFSRDVIQEIVNSKELWNHGQMEDVALSLVLKKRSIKCIPGKACSINKYNNHWLALMYGGEANIEFTNFEDLKNSTQFFYRIKQDHNRAEDHTVMHELYKVLK